jgi:hypothetical protein
MDIRCGKENYREKDVDGDMNYTKIYNQLIERARNRKEERDGYYERHHIIPKCMGGSDDKDNLVKLTAKEHFVAHKLLVEIYPDNGKLIHSYWRMANNKNDDRREYIVGSREYERLKIKHAKEVSIRQRGTIMKWKDNEARSKKIGDFHRGKVVSEETKKLIKKRLKKWYEENESPRLGKTLSEETKQKIREGNLGKKLSEEVKAKIKNLMLEKGITGVPISNEHKENIKKSIQKRKWINDGKINKKINPDDIIPDGWVVGRIISEDHKQKIRGISLGNTNSLGKKWITNGINKRQINPNEELPIGWTYGKRKRNPNTIVNNKWW